MGLWDKIRGEFIDIIEWLGDSGETLVYRFPRYNNEIKYGAKLTVRPGQAAVFVNEGKIADVFQPGMYELKTENLPILSTLKGWKYGFESPFKAEVYFVSTRQITDMKWGTKNPVMMRDAEFGPVRLRAFGTYATRVKNPAVLIEQIAGTDGHFSVEEISDQLRNFIITRFTDLLGESRIPVLDLAANYNELSSFIRGRLGPEFEGYGLEITQFLVENVSLPEEVEKMLDKRTSMGVVGDMQKFTQFQTASAIPDAAKNPGGLAAAGVGLGLGMSMAHQMAGAAGAAGQAAPALALFYIAINGQQAGPFDQAALSQQIRSGAVTRQSLAWRAGMAEWTPAASVPELAGLFGPPPVPGAGPPPIPPASS